MSKRKKSYRVVSLRVKCIAALVCISLIVSVASVVISYRTFSDTTDTQYKTITENIAKTAASQLDAEALNRYYDEVQKIGEYDEDRYYSDEAYRTEFDNNANAIKDGQYNEMLDMLRDIQNNNDVMYLYVQKIDGDMTTYLLDADESEDQCQLGVKHKVSGATLEQEDPRYGVPAFISNDTYGWLCTTFVPVYDNAGEPVALVGADVSMDKVMAERHAYLNMVILVMIIGIVVITALMISAVELSLIRPLNKLAHATSNFVSENEDGDAIGESDISNLKIRTGDEIENLSDSVKTMEKDIISYISNLQQITAEKERIGAELNIATHIQSSMLPCIFPAFPDRTEFDVYATMNPAKEVGGDFYDFFMIDDTHLAVVVADVSGKGVPAALFMVIGKTLIKDHSTPDCDLGKVFTDVNNILCDSNSEGLFITAFEGVLDLVTGEFRFVNAGHEMPCICKANGSYEAYPVKPGFVLAGMENIKYKLGSIMLEPGDKLFQYTDGVTEATDAYNRLFGMERMLDSLNRHKDASPEELLPAIKADIDAFVGDAPQFDDITMLSLEYKERMKPNQEPAE